jgi:hypothetical protein
LKKQKAKKAGGTKKKEEKTETPAEAEAATATEQADEKPEEAAPEPVEATSASPGPVEEDDDEPAELSAPKASHGRKPSIAIESRQRSESFYRSGATGTPTSPNPAIPAGGITSEVYREQALKIEELERENKRLASEVEENQNRWKKGEEELEELREGRGDVALAVEKGKEADKLVGLLALPSVSILICNTESRSRVAQTATITSTVAKHEIHAPHIDRIAQSIRVY